MTSKYVLSTNQISIAQLLITSAKCSRSVYLAFASYMNNFNVRWMYNWCISAVCQCGLCQVFASHPLIVYLVYARPACVYSVSTRHCYPMDVSNLDLSSVEIPIQRVLVCSVSPYNVCYAQTLQRILVQWSCTLSAFQ